MKIALIQPSQGDYIGFYRNAVTEPLGLESIAGALGRHELSFFDMRLDKNVERYLRVNRPDAVGVTIPFTSAVYAGQRVLETIREILPKAFTFVGGHHAGLNPTEFIGQCDTVVLGEGEETARDLVDNVELNQPLDLVPGLMLLKDGKPFKTAERSLVNDLDDLPRADRSISKRYLDMYFFRSMSPVTMVETTRGCPYRCIFCSVWKFNRKVYRQKSPERIIKEIEAVPTEDILFADDNFLSDVKRADRLCALIQESGLKKRYGCQARTDTIAKNPGLIRRLKDIGLKWVLIGFESHDRSQLNRLNKKTDLETNEEAVRVLHDNDIDIQAAFIVDPGYGRADFRALRDYIKRLKISTCQITILTPLPGTELFKQKLHELTTKNYELFDFFHAVIPTKLPLKQFYKEFCRLYRGVQIPIAIREALKTPALPSLTNMLRGVQLSNSMLRTKSYLKGHYRKIPGRTLPE